jgi:hypothetical protein
VKPLSTRTSRSKRELDIETLLKWTYRDELPKDARRELTIERSSRVLGLPSMSPMFRLADLGTTIDDWSREPGFPEILGPPHPDALLVRRAVERLDDEESASNTRQGYRIDWRSARKYLMGPLTPLVSRDDPSLSNARIGRAGLVTTHATMGTRPDWGRITPLPNRVLNANGSPLVEILLDRGGWVPRNRKAHQRGSRLRCRLFWEPDPRTIAFKRIEYAVWIRALVDLVLELHGRLEDHVVLMPRAPVEPWR